MNTQNWTSIKMKALFLCTTPHEQNLPAMEATDTQVGIQWFDADGVLHGGWWVAEDINAPTPNTIPVIIESTDGNLDVFAGLPNMLFIEDIPDVTG